MKKININECLNELNIVESSLRGERHENRCAGSGQSALDLHLIDADRQRGHQPFFLLEVKTLERTVILLGNGGGLEYSIFELLAVGCRVHDEDGHEEQPLIAGLEILQQTLCLTAEGGEIGRDDVHIVAGADRFFLFLNLHLVEVGDLHLDALDCLRLVNRPDMKIDRNVAVHLKEVGKHTVIEFRREDLEEAHRTDGFAHLEALAFTEVEGSGRPNSTKAESGSRSRSLSTPLPPARDTLAWFQ